MSNLSNEDFKRATAVAIKAIVHKAELEVGFAPQLTHASDTRVIVPEPPVKRVGAELNVARGAADAAALYAADPAA